MSMLEKNPKFEFPYELANRIKILCLRSYYYDLYLKAVNEIVIRHDIKECSCIGVRWYNSYSAVDRGYTDFVFFCKYKSRLRDIGFIIKIERKFMTTMCYMENYSFSLESEESYDNEYSDDVDDPLSKKIEHIPRQNRRYISRNSTPTPGVYYTNDFFVRASQPLYDTEDKKKEMINILRSTTSNKIFKCTDYSDNHIKWSMTLNGYNYMTPFDEITLEKESIDLLCKKIQ